MYGCVMGKHIISYQFGFLWQMLMQISQKLNDPDEHLRHPQFINIQLDRNGSVRSDPNEKGCQRKCTPCSISIELTPPTARLRFPQCRGLVY